MSYRCPYCDHFTVTSSENTMHDSFLFNQGNRYGHLRVRSEVIVCSNPDCREYSLAVALYRVAKNPGYHNEVEGAQLYLWRLRPASTAKPFPDYIPRQLISDYEEACLIKDLSPKASATLSRRCLQGIIRNFYGVVKNTLHNEIMALKDDPKVDPDVWHAINAVRTVGNIGAHFEKDIDLIIDVDSSEAELLINLIELLLRETYIHKHERQDNLSKIKALGELKKQLKDEAKE